MVQAKFAKYRDLQEGKKIKSITQELKEKIERSSDLRDKINRISNGQVILFIKHCKINVVRIIEDEKFDDIEN